MPQELVRRVLDLGNSPVPERYPGYRRGTLDLSGECGQVSSSSLNTARYIARFLPRGDLRFPAVHIFVTIVLAKFANTVQYVAKPLDIASFFIHALDHKEIIRVRPGPEPESIPGCGPMICKKKICQSCTDVSSVR
jgi:hypothetical protein